MHYGRDPQRSLHEDMKERSLGKVYDESVCPFRTGLLAELPQPSYDLFIFIFLFHDCLEQFSANPLPKKVMGLKGIVPPGVVTGKDLLKLSEYCRDNGHALPAFNCTSSSTINAVLQVRNVNSTLTQKSIPTPFFPSNL